MSSVCDPAYLVALLEEHGILSSSEHGDWEPWRLGHRRIYERVGLSPTFPLTVSEVRRLLERS